MESLSYRIFVEKNARPMTLSVAIDHSYDMGQQKGISAANSISMRALTKVYL